MPCTRQLTFRVTAALASTALLAGCSVSDRQGDDRSAGHTGRDDTSASQEGHSSDGHTQEDHEAHEHGHSSSSELRDMLMRAADLPAGYQSGGHHHATPTGPAPRLAEECRPLAELVGSHPAVLQDAHPQANRSFSKSHFGPTVGHTVIDYGEPELATAAVERLSAAAQDCERYVQSATRMGATTYTVEPGLTVSDRPGGDAVRLQALGRDFAGITWDVWWVQYGARVVSVNLRSVPHGDTGELPDAVAAALSRMESADS